MNFFKFISGFLKNLLKNKIIRSIVFFLPIIFVICWIINNEYTEFYNSKLFLDNNARILASSYANQISTRLDAKFNTLKFIGDLLLSKNRSTQLIDEKISDFIKYLVQFYPETPAFSIFSSNGQVLWTTLPSKRFVSELNFTPLKINPDYQVGLIYKGFFNTEAISERYTVKNSSGEPIYYVRTAYFINNLFSSDIKNSNFNFVVIDNINNKKIGTLKDGFFIIDTSKTPENYRLSVNVSEYPFEIKVYYPESLIWQNYINSSFERWPLEIIILILTVILHIFLLVFLKSREMNLRRIIDFRSLLSQVNQLLLNVENESTLLQSICDIAVKYGHLKLAFIARPDENDVFRILASSGETDYANSIFISANPNIPEGQGLSGRTWREKRSTYSQSFIKKSFNYPWKEVASKFGIKSSASIPIFRNKEIWSILNVYHGNENVFNEDLKNLLEELSMDISLGLDRLDLRKREKEISEIRKSIIENALIGIALVKDRKFVQVNSKFAQIFGYENTDSLTGKPTKILFFDQDEYDRIATIYDKLFQNKRIEALELFQKGTDGKKIICEVTANVLDENEKTSIWTVQDITERKILEEKLRQSEEDYRLLSIMDSLTSSYNRRYFEQRLEEEIERTKRNKMPFSLIMFDIDDFKTINDTYGHSIGDKVLINVVELVKNRIRKTDFIARWGGEEFMVLLTNTNLQFAEMLALELKNGICKLNIPEIDFVTASFGVTDFHQDDTLNSITKRVDDIMYAAKAAGKNCVKCDLT
jgi:diguanylate cyclase (GGDEF)-like protein/PAS domain S-box-containing protein